MSIHHLKLSACLAAAIGIGAAFGAGAQTDYSGHDMGAHDMGDMNMSDDDMSPAARGYSKAMQTMSDAMASMTSTGDADTDFVRGMIPHHQAAIDMAKVQLEFGKDPAIRKLAQEIIAAQEKEIGQMQAWLKARGAE